MNHGLGVDGTAVASRACIVAEAGVNHNGDEEMAFALVDAALASGADAVKFQLFHADALASAGAPKAPYQEASTSDADTQRDMLRRLELSDACALRLRQYCLEKGLDFLATPFDVASLRLLVDAMDVSAIKVSSGDLTNAPFLYEIARTGHRIILSTGMATLAEVEDALAIIAWAQARPTPPASVDEARRVLTEAVSWNRLLERVTLLHCTTAYPAALAETNLRVLGVLAAAFGVPVGFSDHTEGSIAAIVAVTLGAVFLEKHLTLDRTLPGPDHRASADPEQFSAYVHAVRQAECARGTGRKVPSPEELINRAVARRSLTALTAVQRGELWTHENLGVMRPGDGISPMRFWEYLGTPAQAAYSPGDRLQ